MYHTKSTHYPDLMSETALFQAASTNQLQQVKEYLAVNVNINEQNTQGYTPLHAAAKCGHIEIAMLLLENGALPNIKCIRERTPLMLAAIYGHHEMVELLRKHDADIHIADIDGNTAIHLAANLNNINVVKVLINHHFQPKNDEAIRLINLFPPHPTANIFSKNKAGHKAIDLAKHETRDLLSNAELLSQNLFNAIRAIDTDTIFECLSSGAYISDEMKDEAIARTEISEWLSEASPAKSRMSLK